MDAPTLLSAFLGVLALVAVVASAVAVSRANMSKTTIEEQDKLVKALTGRATFLEAEVERLNTRVDGLTAENAALQTYVSGTDAVKELAAAMGKQNLIITREHHDILASVHAQAEILTAQHGEIVTLIRATAHTHGEAA